MTTITMTQTATQNRQTYTNGQTYTLRSREAKLLLLAGKANKSATKGH
jgi:hypothetical protein